MRVQVTISDKMIARLDGIVDETGMSRSAVCNMLIGQGIASWERAHQMMSVIPSELAEKLIQKN